MLKKEATYFSPDLVLTDDLLHVSGKLWMENPFTYFQDIIAEIKKSQSDEFLAIFEVDYINSSSTKQLLLFFELLKDLLDRGKFKSVVIIWYVDQDDQDILETINDLKNVSELNMKISFNKK